MTGGGRQLKKPVKSKSYLSKILSNLKYFPQLFTKKVKDFYKKLTFAAYDKIGGEGSCATHRFCNLSSSIREFRANRKFSLLDSKGSIIIEFAICMPVLIILLYYINDLSKLKRYYDQTEFVAQQMVNMIQNVSQKRGATDSSKLRITKQDLGNIHRLAWQTMYPGDTMFLGKNSKFPLDHRPLTSIYYVIDTGNGKASCIWRLWLRFDSLDWFGYDVRTDDTVESTVNFLTDVSPEKIYPTLKMNGKPKIIVETLMERSDTHPYFTNSSDKAAFSLYLANIKSLGNSWSHMFHSVVIFTPKDGLFSETAPQ